MHARCLGEDLAMYLAGSESFYSLLTGTLHHLLELMSGEV